MSTTATTTDIIELQPLPSLLDKRHSETHETTISNSNKTLANHAAEENGTPLSEDQKPMSKLQITLTILQPAVINFFGSFSSGVIMVGLPIIASSISLQRSLWLWPSSVYSLTSGAALLIAGSICDVVGARLVEVYGIFLLGIFVLACGFAQTGIQLVVFRALQGIALAMHIPASVSIISTALPEGRARNIGFGCLGLTQPLGFSFGMVASGIMIERIGWRSGFYLAGGGILVAAIGSWLTLPKVKGNSVGLTVRETLWKIKRDIDWIGGSIASSGLALLSYVLAMVSADLTSIRSATTASLLGVSLAMLISFPLWMQYRERKEKSALVPNSLWKKLPFTSICALVGLSYGAMNSIELFCSLYFQEVQNFSPLTTSLYLLPNLAAGVLINFSVGLFIDRVPAGILVVITSILSSIAPLMMALVDPNWKYWTLELWAQVLASLSTNVLYTVGLIIVSDNFPKTTQGLAGAVFSTVSQFGTSLGVGVCQVVALGVIGDTGSETEGDGGNMENESATGSDKRLMLKGYRASFWTMFALMVGCVFIAVAGLRRTGKVGEKKKD